MKKKTTKKKEEKIELTKSELNKIIREAIKVEKKTKDKSKIKIDDETIRNWKKSAMGMGGVLLFSKLFDN